MWEAARQQSQDGDRLRIRPLDCNLMRSSSVPTESANLDFCRQSWRWVERQTREDN